MNSNKYTGKMGEDLAVSYLENKGYRIRERNWRHRNWEVDLIASRGNRLYFLEVKTRRSLRYGYPEESISYEKMTCLKNAAEAYQYKHPEWQYIQFDVLAITLHPESGPELLHLEDVYF